MDNVKTNETLTPGIPEASQEDYNASGVTNGKLEPGNQLPEQGESDMAIVQGSDLGTEVAQKEERHQDTVMENSESGAIQEISGEQESQKDLSDGTTEVHVDAQATPSVSSPSHPEVAKVAGSSSPRSVKPVSFATPESHSPSKIVKYGSFSSFRYTKPGSEPLSHSRYAKRGNIDTAAPFESVKEAVSKFGGIVDWKAHKMQTVERRKEVEQELEKVQEEIPSCKKKLDVVEEEKMEMLKELDSTKRQIEELKLNLERAQTEEQQAKQDSELAELRVEEMEQGIADDSSVAAKAQLEVAKARYTAAVSELQSVKEELDSLHKEYASLVTEKETAKKKAEEAISLSKETEKTMEELTIELIATKESLESAHAAHLEAEEQRIGAAMARDQDCHNWEREVKQSEEELKRLHQKTQSAKDVKSKLETASALLQDLKAELAAYMELKLKQDLDEEEKLKVVLGGSEKKAHTDIQAAVASAKKELAEVTLNIQKANTEVNLLKEDATSLQSELEKEKAALASLSQREGIASVAVSSLEAELERTKSEIVQTQEREKEARERTLELPKELQQAAKEADEVKSVSESAREELRKAKEEAEQAKAGVSTLESRLLAAQKEIEASRATEKLALAAMKALEESESGRSTTDVESSANGVTLSLEEYYELSKRAHDAEEQANMRVTSAISQIEAAKESEMRTLETLEEVNKEIIVRRQALGFAMDKAEKAKAGKLGVEQELRNWRAEHEQLRKAGESAHARNSLEKTGTNNFSGNPKASTPGSNTESDLSPEVTVVKKKKKSFFPRLIMFLGRRKTHASKSK